MVVIQSDAAMPQPFRKKGRNEKKLHLIQGVNL